MNLKELAKDLFTDHGTGKFSHTKLWANVGYPSVIVPYAHNAWTGNMSADLTLVVLGGVCGSALASKIVSMKFGGSTPTPPPGESSEGESK